MQNCSPEKQHSSWILVWDAEGSPPEDSCFTVLWRRPNELNRPGTVSLPTLIEERDGELRQKFLEFVDSLGERPCGLSSLRRSLQYDGEFSYWWMSLFVEKCNWSKSPGIHDVLRLFLLEEILDTRCWEKLVLVSQNCALAEVVSGLCRSHGHHFQWGDDRGLPVKRIQRKRIAGEGGRAFVATVVYFMKYLVARLPLMLDGRKKDVPSARTAFIDYFANYDHDKAQQGIYRSAYWTDLHSLLEKEKIPVTWLHLFVSNRYCPDPVEAARIVSGLQDETAIQKHYLWEQWLNWRVVLLAVLDYVRLIRTHMALRRKVPKIFQPEGSKLQLWPICKKDWLESIFGPTAAWNCISYRLMQNALGSMPTIQTGFYLQENQGWERALIHLWRRAGHGVLVGVPHSTIRFWDLRYYSSPATLNDRGNKALPQPDFVALNGPIPFRCFQEAHYSPESLVEVEALRYLYLLSWKYSQKNLSGKKKVLVCGDYEQSTNRAILLCLEKAFGMLPTCPEVIIKPHPVSSLEIPKGFGLKYSLDSRPLLELFTECHVVIASAITSAALDAYYCDLPVIIFLEGKGVNMSPLRGVDIAYATDEESMLEGMRNALEHHHVRAQPQLQYFWLDRDLPRWRRLLKARGCY